VTHPFFDHHVHSIISGDSDVPLEERARTAASPARPHGISDHFPSPRLRDDDEVLGYVERARELGLFVALEYDIGVAPPLRPSTRQVLDYLVGGVHQVTVRGRELSYDAAGAFLKGHVDIFAERALYADDGLGREILEEILRSIEAAFERDRIDVLAHPTFSPLAALADVETAYPIEWQERLIGSCVRYGVALEVNESYRVPHPSFLRRARALGATLAVGSDSHAALLPLRYVASALSEAGAADRVRDLRRAPAQASSSDAGTERSS
jgi:histidinol phosphatase-like PHP family hydrolase